jgi:hypothetical protein
MRKLSRALAVAGLTLLAGASRLAAAPPETAIDAEVLKLRESAWRAWFAGDVATLGAMLPPEFIGINMQAGPFSTLERTLEESRAFHAQGGRLTGLEFPETQAQRYGDVLVLYGRYAVTFVPTAGAAEQKVSGRLTELFVRRDGRWLHTGWHLDTVAGS